MRYERFWDNMLKPHLHWWTIYCHLWQVQFWRETDHDDAKIGEDAAVDQSSGFIVKEENTN